MEARVHVWRILRHTNSVRQVLFRLRGQQAILRLRRSFGSLTGKNIQHVLLRHGLGPHCTSPCLVGPGAQRGILHMAGRSRLAGFGDSSWPQLLQWRQDLEDSRRKILSAFRLDFPEARRGKGKGHGRIPGQDPWLSSSPRARAALLTLAKGLPLEDLDCQFILCEIGKQLGGLLLRVGPRPAAEHT